MDSNEKRALVVFSGGQDSTTCLALALREYGKGNVDCITFRYGQRHAQEMAAARKIAADFGIANHRIVTLDNYGQLTDSALLDPSLPIETAEGASCPNTVVDGRNMLFLLMAAIAAKRDGIRDLVTGVCEADSSGYPDCRAAFIQSCNATLNLAMDYPFRIRTPLMSMTKAQVWALADELGILGYVAEHTLTCYNGIPGRGCGACPACILRQRGYEEYRGKEQGVRST